MGKRRELSVFFGHHKAATTWLNSIVSSVCRDMGLKHAYVSNPKMFNFELQHFVQENKINFLSYTNADYKYVENLENFKGFHVIRDPRDVLVSGYFSHLHSHAVTKDWPELAEHREKLKKLSKDEGLLLEMQFSKRFLEEMYSWNYHQSNVLEIKMEDLVISPYKSIISIIEFLGILDEAKIDLRSYVNQSIKIIINRFHANNKLFMPFSIPLDKVPGEILLKYIYARNYKRISNGRKPGEENIKSHYRKGISGDWKNHFKEEHTEYFKNQYNDVLLKLKYENDDKWWNTSSKTEKYLIT